MRKWFAFAALLLAGVRVPTALAEGVTPCPDLVPKQEGVATVTEPVPRIWPLCYTIATTPGHPVELSVTRADEMRLSVFETRPERRDERSIVSDVQNFTLQPKVESYHVLVGSGRKPNESTRSFTFKVEWK